MVREADGLPESPALLDAIHRIFGPTDDAPAEDAPGDVGDETAEQDDPIRAAPASRKSKKASG